MKFSLILCLLLLGVVGTVNAQIRVLWSVGLTNAQDAAASSNNSHPTREYGATTAALDAAGNTIVAGKAHTWAPRRYEAFVAKINTQGTSRWEYVVGSQALVGVDALEVDRLGNVLFAARLSYREPHPWVLIKLSPDGRELWRTGDLHAVWGPYPALAIKTDAGGNVYLLALLADGPSPARLYLTKFNAAGKRLWRSQLPQQRYVLTTGGLARGLSLSPDGTAIVSGLYDVPSELTASPGFGFVAKLDVRGRLQWWTAEQEILSDPPRGRSRMKLPYFTSVQAGRYGTICAAASDQGFAIFSSRGKLLRTGNLAGNVGGEVVAATAGGGFLLAHYGGYVAELDAVGHVLWQASSWAYPFGGMVRDRQGWLTAGEAMGLDAIRFTQFNQAGTRLWSTILLSHLSLNGIRDAFHRAPDGTFRVVHAPDYGYYYDYRGVLVTAFALEEAGIR